MKGLVKSELMRKVGYPLTCVALVSMSFAPAVAAAVDADGSTLSGATSGGNARTSGQASNLETPTAKDETVYVHMAPDGTVTDEEVTAKLVNGQSATQMADTSILSGIEGKDDGVSYSGTAENMMWESNGKDITYKGKTDATVPVEVKVTYRLDGKEIDPSELAGKSGHVVIRYDYVNNSETTVEVDGAQQTVKTPFVMVTALLLDSDVFSNVEVDNARVLEDGNRTIVLGYAMPGLADSLDVASDDDVDIPDYVELEADVKGFEMKSTLTMASPSMFDDINADFDTAELSEASSALKEAMSELETGSYELADALALFAAGIVEAQAYSDAIVEGSEELAAGADNVAKGASQIESGTKQLPAYANQLATGSRNVESGLAQVRSGLQTVDGQLLAIIEGQGAGSAHVPGLKEMSASTGQLVTAADSLYALLDASTVTTQSDSTALRDKGAQLAEAARAAEGDAAAANDAIESVRISASSVEASADQAASDIASAGASLDSIDLSAIEDEAVRAQLQASIDAARSQVASAESSALVASGEASSLAGQAQAVSAPGVVEVQSALEDLAKASDVAPQADYTQTAKELAGQIKQGLAGLDSGLDGYVAALTELEDKGIRNGVLASDALPALEEGASQVASGNAALEAQSKELSGGVSELSKATSGVAIGSRELSDGLGAFSAAVGSIGDAASVVATGGRQLASGIAQFGDEGISKVTDAIDNKLVKYGTRYRAVVEAGKQYRNFSGITDGTDGSVKFVFETDPIG